MIKNIIFDFGGVLIHIDYKRTEHAFSELLNAKFSLDLLSGTRKIIFDDYEVGNISTENFIWNIQHYFGQDLDPRAIIDAWNSMLIGIPSENLLFLKQLKDEYKIYLMSNTNEIHMNWVYHHLKHVHGVLDFDKQFFDKTYYSHKIGLRKPSEQIFDQILNQNKISASETLFVDDIEINLVPPSKLGINTYLHPRNEDISLVKELIENKE